jgi:hypothetical protein
MVKIEGSGSGSINRRHGSAEPDPDPHQNVMDPQTLQIIIEHSNVSHVRYGNHKAALGKAMFGIVLVA